MKAPLAILAALALYAGVDAPAEAAEREVSADTVESRSGLGNHAGRLYLRGNDSRYEHQVMGLPVVEIDLPEQGVRRVLFPLTRSYTELSLAALPKEIAATFLPPVNAPCSETPRLSCKRTGEAEIAGIKTEVWTMRAAGAPADSTVHWDPARRLALRETHADGRTLEATRLGSEPYENLEVERWRITYAYPGGMRLEGQALVSPDLGITIAERRPDGASRQLVNVAKGGVDASMFAVPKGYRRIPGPGDAPPAPAPGVLPGMVPGMGPGHAGPGAGPAASPAQSAPPVAAPQTTPQAVPSGRSPAPAATPPAEKPPAAQQPSGDKSGVTTPEKKDRTSSGAVTPLAEPAAALPTTSKPISAEVAHPATSELEVTAALEPKPRVEAALASENASVFRPAGFTVTDAVTLADTTVPVPARNPGLLAALDVPEPERKPATLAAPAAPQPVQRAVTAVSTPSARASASAAKTNAARGAKRRASTNPTRNTKRRRAG